MKKIPSFKKLDDEKVFWEKEDSTKYIDWTKAKLAKFPNLKPSTKTISIRLPASLLNELKIFAHKKNIPCQSLIKIMLAHELETMRSCGRNTR